MIPLFQRPFTWGEANFESLWNDVIEVYEAEEQHFLGSIVTKVLDATPQGVSRFLVIDGQQRLTTLIILLAAGYSAPSPRRPSYPTGISDTRRLTSRLRISGR